MIPGLQALVSCRDSLSASTTSSSFSHSLRSTAGNCACLRPAGPSESVSWTSRHFLGKDFISFADFEKARSGNSNCRRKRSVARAGDSAIVRAVVASAEEEAKVIAPEDVLIVDNKQRQDQERVGVLLLNLGGPDTLEDVQPFLYNLFADPVHFSLRPLRKFVLAMHCCCFTSLKEKKHNIR